ncbi:ABC transporter permease [Amycolatopsis panacis]|uniref:ABC transporter permease n=1 Tax=Amycolatopsis panacis TaxID=2340917 RepID=A0A419HYA7_9PSEU|nr:ABC transporter permease [Amycolatopsis panacis]RJQ82109.1 ABC transporter permease [Amycolatopsis panacis]
MTVAEYDLGKARDKPRLIRRLRRVRGAVVVSFAIMGLALVMALFGQWLVPQDPAAQDLTAALAPPSGAHWLGTDELGRDVFSRLIAGSRTAFFAPLVVAGGAMLFGNVLGLLAGYRGGIIDAFIMRLADLLMAVPGLLIIIVVAGTIGGGFWTAVILLMALMVPFDARVVRGATLEQVPRPYVEAARTLGVPNRRIMFLHIWPNISAVVVANTCIGYAGALVGLSGLSFLGIGVTPGSPDWGQMLSDGQASLFENPIATLAPGAAVVLIGVAMNIIGDWGYDRISGRGGER